MALRSLIVCCILSVIPRMQIGRLFCILILLRCALAQEAFVNVGQQPLDVRSAVDLPNLAVVSTWRGTPLTWANSWLRYHIAIGFNRIYLFFDDPKHDKEVIDVLSNAVEYKEILTIIKVDKKYRRKYWTLQEGGPNEASDPEQWLLPAVGVHILTEHTARQLLNVARAGVLAKSDNIAWLLHIDSDELFWLPGLKSGIAKSLFSQLTNRNITHATFFNNEVARKTPDYESKKLPKDPFHQRLLFLRNEMTLNQKQSDHFRRLQAEKGMKPFLGYMCGKGAINVALWRKNFGEASPILPQHVVSFAYSYFQPGNVTPINLDTTKMQPYISSKKIKVACVTTVARILHYVNPDLESMLDKFSARTKFNTDIFDINLVQNKEKNMYDKWRSNWVKPEKMPNWEFYNEMWSLVRKGLQAKNDEKARDFYMKGAVTPQGNQLEQYIESGLIYENKEIMQFLLRISQLFNKKEKLNNRKILIELCNGDLYLNAGDGSAAGKETYTLYNCKKKAPHFQCDIENCCGLLRWPQFTFTKRLLGYRRYAAFEWWKPGLKWPR